MATVLIASLGESPVVVTATCDLLQKKLIGQMEDRKGLPYPTERGKGSIELLEVLTPSDEEVQRGYDFIEKGIRGKPDLAHIKVSKIPLSFEDANSEPAGYEFLRTLSQRLQAHQDQGDTVYLSLAGGRKNMSVLMTILSQFYSCIDELYHIHDQDEFGERYHFVSAATLLACPPSLHRRILFPEGKDVQLINIPYGEKQRASGRFMQELLTLADAEQAAMLKDIGMGDEQAWLLRLLRSRIFPAKAHTSEKLFSEQGVVNPERERILIIPLGTSPMVATQLATLFQDKGYTLRKVILIYTTHRTVVRGVQVLREAFRDEGIAFQDEPLTGLKDITSREDCERYQQQLEQIIDAAYDQNRNCQIELSIAGGRKGMAALTMLVAQQKNILHVHHTLIIDTATDKAVSEQTTIDELEKLGRSGRKRERNDRLFLRSYDTSLFALFDVLVIPDVSTKGVAKG